MCTTDPKKRRVTENKDEKVGNSGKTLVALGIDEKTASISLCVYAKRNVPGLKYGNENFRLGCPSGRVKYPFLSLSLFPSISLHARGGGGGGK